MSLRNAVLKNMSGKFKRAGISKTSQWAELYRVLDGKPYGFENYPWAKIISDTKGEFCVMKGSQIGLTQLCLNRSFKTIDIDKDSVLYILPTLPMANRFADTKFDPAIEESPHIRNMFTEVNSKTTKVAGKAALFILGSKSRADMKGVNVRDVYIDEYDECDDNVLKLARERCSSFMENKEHNIGIFSTPTLPNYGIHEMFTKSTASRFQFLCPHCDSWTELEFLDGDDQIVELKGDEKRYGNLVICGEDPEMPRILDSYYITSCCNKVLTHEQKKSVLTIPTSRFVSDNPDRLIEGFYVNQLVSPTVTADIIARNYLQALGDPAAMTEFKNHQIGHVHEDKEASLRWADFEEAMTKSAYSSIPHGVPNRLITIGVDVGKKLTYVVCAFQLNKSANIFKSSHCQVLEVGELDHFTDVDVVFKRFRAHFLVVDAQPERRKSMELCERFPTISKMCFYVQGQKNSKEAQTPEESYAVTVDRTSWLDGVYQRFRNKTISIPSDITPQFYPQLKSLVKTYKLDRYDEMKATYVKTNKNDHYAHALLYANLGFVLSYSIKMNIPLADIL